MTTLFSILFTAVFSAALTLGAAWWVFKNYFLEDFQKALDEKVEEVGAKLEARVREGVRLGVIDGVAQLPTTEVLNKTTENVVRTGQTRVEQGLGSILGPRKKP